MNSTAELKKFVSSQYIYSGVRVAAAILIPSIIFAYFGVLKEFFLFPLGTSFIGLTDQPGPFVRRRNSLLLAVFTSLFAASVALMLKDYPLLVFLEILVFGLFFAMIGVYGQRLASVGSLTLVVLSIFIDGHLAHGHILQSLAIFLAGCVWYFLVFLTLAKIQPYKLASQMIGENYLELAEYLRIKAGFYAANAEVEALFAKAIAQQVKIKELQEDTREVVFRTRTMVNESTTTSRLLMLMFLNSVDLHELLMTSESDYKKIQDRFSETGYLTEIRQYLLTVAEEITNIGIALQTSERAKPRHDISAALDALYGSYFDLRNSKISPENLEDFMILRQILVRITEVTEEVKGMYTVYSQDISLAKSLSSALDFKYFLPAEEQLHLRVMRNNFSLKSGHFRHAVRVTAALLLGYGFSLLNFSEIGHSYWILITILAIMRPAYATTKHRNRLRLLGTVAGAIVAYLVLHIVHSPQGLLILLFAAMILCFTLLKSQYAWAVFFMTIYIFLSFNFMNPGHVNEIFRDRILDTAIGGAVVFLVSYFVLPVWEHSQNSLLMMKSAEANLEYFRIVMSRFSGKPVSEMEYKIKRREAVISLANLSDNFQRMISDPKNRRIQLQKVHQFVNTSHLITAYTASLSRFAASGEHYPEIDSEAWSEKISTELSATNALLSNKAAGVKEAHPAVQPMDLVEKLLVKRKKELQQEEQRNRRDPAKLSHLTKLSNIRQVLELIFDVAKEQRKVAEKYRKITALPQNNNHQKS